MKTYKTWEMVRALTENPKKKFTSHELDGNKNILKAGAIRDAIRFSMDGDNWNTELIGISLERVWEEEIKPLSFIEVLETVKESHGIIITTQFEGYTYTGQLDDLLSDLADDLCNDELIKALLEGEFYIE